MSAMPMPACPICSASATLVYVAAEHRFYRCTQCRTAFVSPVPSDQELALFYDRFHRSTADGGNYDEVEDRMQADFPAKVERVRLALRDPSFRVLDVGCGKGYFVKACVDQGIKAQGIDLSETGIAFARNGLGVEAQCGSLAELKASLGHFDVVTFWATIEHLPDPIQMLRDISDVLTPGGQLLLDTGIGDDWLDRLLPGRVQWYDPPQHLFVFSAAGIQRALEQAGFSVQRIDRNFERTVLRRGLKTLRNGLTAASLRAVSEVGRIVHKDATFVRFPMGNLMSISAIKSRADARVE